MNPNISYNDREEIINKKNNENLNQLKYKILELKNQKNEIKSWSLKELIEKRPPKNFFEENVENEKLLTYLLSYGYIDEMYESYISYFYEGTLTREDKDFILGVKDRNPFKFEYQLTKINGVIDWLTPFDFKKDILLNNSLLDFILENKSNYSDQLSSIISQLPNKSKRSIDFFDNYIENGKHIESFIHAVCKKWTGIWHYIESESNYPNEKKEEYLKLIIKYSDINEIDKLNIDSLLSVFISKKHDFLSFISDKKFHPNLKYTISNLDIEFEYLERPFASDDLFDHIYENNHYQINSRMIELVIKEKSKKNIDFKKLESANYTTILDSECSHLIEYIESSSRINTYIQNVFLKLENNIHESQEALIKLLHNSEITVDDLGKILEKQTTNIDDITYLNSEVWFLVFQFNKIKPTWQNVIKYYEVFQEMDDTIISYLNNDEVYLKLSKEKIPNDDKDSELTKFCEKLILTVNISDESYKNLVKSINKTYSSLSFQDLSEEKVTTLIENNTISLSNDNFNLIEEHFPNITHFLLEKNINEYLNDFDEYEVDDEDMVYLFRSDNVTIQNKLELFKKINDDNLTTRDGKIGTALSEILPDNEHTLYSYDTLEFIISNSEYQKNSIKIFNSYFYGDTLSEHQITDILYIIGEPYSKITVKSKRPKIENKDINVELATILEKVKYISSFKKIGSRLRIINRLK